MIRKKHIFHNNTSSDGNGIDYLIGNKNTDTVMIVSCGDLNKPATATGCTLTFYGKVAGSNEYVAIKGLKASDYTLQSTGTINQSYIIDCTSYQGIRVALSNVQGGKVTVIGEVID